MKCFTSALFVVGVVRKFVLEGRQISPGERYDILINGRDGTFPFHDHIVSNVSNGGVYPGGMLTLITGGEPVQVSASERSVHFGKEAKPSKFAAQEADHDHSDRSVGERRTRRWGKCPRG